MRWLMLPAHAPTAYTGDANVIAVLILLGLADEPNRQPCPGRSTGKYQADWSRHPACGLPRR